MLVSTDCGSARARQQQQLDFKLLPSILLYIVTEYSSDTDAEQQEAFDGVKHALTHAPSLAYPLGMQSLADFDQPFQIVTDTSGYGFGAVLMQAPHLLLQPEAEAIRNQLQHK